MALPPRMLQLMDEGRRSLRGLMLINFPAPVGPIGMWNGHYDLTWNGQLFRPNQFLQAEEGTFTTGLDAAEFKVILPERSDFGITPDTLAQIETLPYKRAPIRIYDADFDPDTGALLFVKGIRRGYIDFFDHVIDNGELKLVGNCKTRAQDNHRDGYRAASDEDQQKVSAGDKFLEYAGVTRVETQTVKFESE